MRHPYQRGATALLLALALPLLIGMAGLVIDLGRLFVFKAELQNAMDACALAASTQLTQVNDARLYDVARAQALALTDPNAAGSAARPVASVNRLHFQRDALSANTLEVSFAANLDGPYVTATGSNTQGLSPTQARFARCRYTDAGIGLSLLQALGAFVPGVAASTSVAAQATAVLSPARQVCAVPMAICAASGGTATNNYGLSIGQRLTAVNDPTSGYSSGNYGWADFDPPNGGASALAALIEGNGACGVPVGKNVGQSGKISSLAKSWNTRFGIYGGGTSLITATPDYTGYGYASGSSNFSDYIGRRALRTAFQGTVKGGTSTLTAQQYATLGEQRRVVTAPIVACSAWNGGKTSAKPPILDFACALMLAPVPSGSSPSGTGVATTMDLEFLGVAGTPGSGCATLGEVGSGTGSLVPGLIE